MTADLPVPLRRRFVWLVLLVGVLFARGLTPEGWMPVANAAGGIDFTLCTGMGPVEAKMPMAHGKMHHKMPAKGQPGAHPCAFAGLGLADAIPPLPAIVAPLRPAIVVASIARVVAAPGRGLAAPPPPATGPPALA